MPRQGVIAKCKRSYVNDRDAPVPSGSRAVDLVRTHHRALRQLQEAGAEVNPWWYISIHHDYYERRPEETSLAWERRQWALCARQIRARMRAERYA
jgi:hypothetical protein